MISRERRFVIALATLPEFGADTKYLAATIACTNADAACFNPITVYLHRCERDVVLAGLDR